MLSDSVFEHKDQKSLLHTSNYFDLLSPQLMLLWWKLISIFTVSDNSHPQLWSYSLTSSYRNKLVLFLRHRHRSHASSLHTLFRRHRAHARRHRSHHRRQTTHLRSRPRSSKLLFQTWAQALRILRTMDKSFVLGREMDLHRHTLCPKRRRYA